MGRKLLEFYHSKLKRESKFAFAATFIIALLIHLYKFTNTLPNHDSLYNYYSDQNVLGSGRWALSLACGIGSYYDLPWINGLLCCVYIALAVVTITALFKLRNPVLIVIVGALLAASPATTETLFFLFTADGYMLAMFLSALSVYLSRLEENKPYKWVLSGLCICVSCGIYQAYVSFALLLAVCYFIVHLFRNQYGKLECWKWVLRQVIIYGLSLAVYYVIWKLCMHFSGTAINNYQGIAEVGKFNLSFLVSGPVRSILSVVAYFTQWNVLDHGWTLYSVLSLLFILVLFGGLLLSIFKSGILKRKWAVVLLLLCLIAIVPFACIWHFTSNSVGYRPMMLQSLTLLFVLVALLYEEWAGPIIKNAVAMLLVIIVINNANMANISYFYMNLAYERTYADAVEIMMEIHDLSDEYEFDEIAVIGNRSLDMTWTLFDPETGETTPAGKIFLLTNLLSSNWLMDHEHVVSYLQTTYGMKLEGASDGKLKTLMERQDVDNMGCWPAGDSIAVIDGTLVIKLADVETAELA